MGTEQNLLFAILALQAGHINSGRFAEACALWTGRKAVPLADLLVEHGWLTPADRSDLNRLMDSKLQERGGNARASLEVEVNDEVRRVLAVLGDPDIEHSLGDLPPDLEVLSSTENGVSIRHDRYRLDRLHATGGTGRVWLARDRDLGRDVALKELRTNGARSAKVYERFLREAQITGQLEHPGIVPVYELTRQADKQPFYTMRFVKGRTLTEAIRAYHREKAVGQAGQLEQLALLNAFVCVCNTIAYAHSRGVIHRDLKGQNVVLGDFGEVMVLDWGLAKLRDRPGEDSVAQPLVMDGTFEAEATQEGQVMGTPAYMAPEQAGGQLELVDCRTDVYGLGAILYELLTGRPPFLGVDTQDVLCQVRDKEPSPPSQICENVPPALEAVCLNALAKDPEERFHSAAELALEVQRWLADEPVAAYPEPWRARTRRWLGRHRALIAVLGASFLVAAVCLAGATSLLTVANQRERQATTLLLEREEEARAERDRAQVSFKLALNAVTVLSNQVSDDPRLGEKDLEGLRKELLESGLRFYEELARLQSANPALQADRGRTLLLLGRIAEEIAPVEEARKAYQEACGLFEQLTHDSPTDTEHHYNLARSYSGLANGCLKTGQFREAQTAFQQASVHGEQAVRERPENAEYRDSLASIYLQHGNLYRETFSRNVRYPNQPKNLVEQAETLYQKALAIEEALAGEFADAPRYQHQVGRIYRRQGTLRQHVGLTKDALVFHVRARELFEMLVCEFPRETNYQFQLAQVLCDLGWSYIETGQGERAEPAYKEALDMSLQLVREHPEIIEYQHGLCTCWNQMACLQALKGRAQEANAASQEAWSIADKLIRKYPRVEKPLGALNVAFRDLVGRSRRAGKPIEGLSWCQKQIQTLELVLQEPQRVQAAPWHLCYAYVQGGLFLNELGHHSEALMKFSRALDLADGQPHNYRLLLRAWVLAHMGQHAAASAQACEFASRAPVVDRCLYYAACVHSLASEAARNDSDLSPADRNQLAEEYATRALDFLNQARANGYFKNAVNIVPLKTDDDFAPLRKRADFGQFLLLLEQERDLQAQPSGVASK